MEHFETGPSSANEWSNCKAWLQMRRNCPPDEGSFAANEGTTAHHFSEEAIKCGHYDVHQFVGQVYARTGIECTEEMAEFCNVYTGRVKQLVDMCSALGVEVDIKSEHRVDLTHIYPGFFGTRDLHAVAVNGNWAIVADLKYGRTFVSAQDNRQIMCYALDIIKRYPNVEEVRAEIIQPRCEGATGAIRTATYTRSELEAFAVLATEYQAANHSDEIQTPTAGAHCTYCRANGRCRANAEYVMGMVTPAKFNPNLLSSEEVQKIIKQTKLVKNFLDGAYRWGLHLAQQGTEMKDLKMVKVKSREAPKKDITVEEAAKAIRLVTGKEPDMDKIAPRKIGALSAIRKEYGDTVAKMLSEPKTETLALRGIEESGTPEQSPMMIALNQTISKLEK
jgi:hypothetical protein